MMKRPPRTRRERVNRVKVVPISPRGYCYGVVDALNLVKRVASDPETPKPVYILGHVVHNRHAVASLEDFGVISLDGPDRLALLDQIDSGTVIFTAHGVSPAVKRKALAKGLYCVDATCPDVTRTHELVKSLATRDYHILYIGKKGHPEAEGVIGECPERVHLVEGPEDLDGIPLPPGPVAVTTQTTLSKWDTEATIEAILARYPNAEVYNELCLATQERQEAAVQQGRETDLVLVVGDTRSNNSNRLVQVVREIAGRPAYLIGGVEDIRPEWLAGKRRVGVTAGSSTPSQLTRAVIEYLQNLDLEVYAPSDAALSADRPSASPSRP